MKLTANNITTFFFAIATNELSLWPLGKFDNNSRQDISCGRTNSGWLQYMGTVQFITMGRPKGRHFQVHPDRNLPEIRENLFPAVK